MSKNRRFSFLSFTSLAGAEEEGQGLENGTRQGPQETQILPRLKAGLRSARLSARRRFSLPPTAQSNDAALFRLGNGHPRPSLDDGTSQVLATGRRESSNRSFLDPGGFEEWVEEQRVLATARARRERPPLNRETLFFPPLQGWDAPLTPDLDYPLLTPTASSGAVTTASTMTREDREETSNSSHLTNASHVANTAFVQTGDDPMDITPRRKSLPVPPRRSRTGSTTAGNQGEDYSRASSAMPALGHNSLDDHTQSHQMIMDRGDPGVFSSDMTIVNPSMTPSFRRRVATTHARVDGMVTSDMGGGLERRNSSPSAERVPSSMIETTPTGGVLGLYHEEANGSVDTKRPSRSTGKPSETKSATALQTDHQSKRNGAPHDVLMEAATAAPISPHRPSQRPKGPRASDVPAHPPKTRGPPSGRAPPFVEGDSQGTISSHLGLNSAELELAIRQAERLIANIAMPEFSEDDTVLPLDSRVATIDRTLRSIIPPGRSSDAPTHIYLSDQIIGTFRLCLNLRGAQYLLPCMIVNHAVVDTEEKYWDAINSAQVVDISGDVPNLIALGKRLVNVDTVRLVLSPEKVPWSLHVRCDNLITFTTMPISPATDHRADHVVSQWITNRRRKAPLIHVGPVPNSVSNLVISVSYDDRWPGFYVSEFERIPTPRNLKRIVIIFVKNYVEKPPAWGHPGDYEPALVSSLMGEVIRNIKQVKFTLVGFERILSPEARHKNAAEASHVARFKIAAIFMRAFNQTGMDWQLAASRLSLLSNDMYADIVGPEQYHLETSLAHESRTLFSV